MRALFIFLLIICYNCSPGDLYINKIENCELFQSNGSCKEKLLSNHTYKLAISKEKILNMTWKDFGNHLYFQSKNTPGILLHFNRRLNEKEKETLSSSFHAVYRIGDYENRMEGQEIGEDWIGAFQYLGSIIKDERKIMGKADERVSLKELFPLNIKLRYTSAYFDGESSVNIDLEVQP